MNDNRDTFPPPPDMDKCVYCGGVLQIGRVTEIITAKDDGQNYHPWCFKLKKEFESIREMLAPDETWPGPR